MVHRHFHNATICDSERGTIHVLIQKLLLHLDSPRRCILPLLVSPLRKNSNGSRAVAGLEPLLILPAGEGMLLSDSASLCSQSSLADNSFLLAALLCSVLPRADPAFTPQITQKNRLGLLFVSYNLAALARVQLMLTELLHDFACGHRSPFSGAIAASLEGGACCSALKIIARLAKIYD
jgi:hypothetical protein